MDRPIELLFVLPSLAGGGAERVSVTLLRHLDRKKFHITLAVVDMRNSVFLNEIESNVAIVDLGCTRVRQALPKLIALLWRKKPDLVFSTLGYLNLALAICRLILPNSTRYVARESSIVSEVVKYKKFPGCWIFGYRWFYSSFDRVICQSEYMANDLVNNFNIKRSIISVINNPVDIDRVCELSKELIPEVESFLPSCHPGTVQLVAAGRLVAIKGFDLLIKAVSRCRDLSLRLVVLGDGPKRDCLSGLCEELLVSDIVKFVGFHANPYPFFSHADAFILCSRYEGFPNVVLEALACGTPVIATPAPGGTIEILKDIPECEVAKDISVVALEDAIRRWVAGDRQRVDVLRIRPYQVTKIVNQYQNVFLDILSSPKDD